MQTLMSALKEKQEQNLQDCLAKAKYHRAEAKKAKDSNSRAYHRQQANFWTGSARYWKTHLPSSI